MKRQKLKKIVWYECPVCHAKHHDTVKARVEEDGRLVPLCEKCDSPLVRRSKKIEA